MNIEQYIESCPDFPKPGVLFWDFVPLLAEPSIFKLAIQRIKTHYLNKHISHIVAIEAKGFAIGAALAYEMGLPLLLIRKPGLIPKKINTASFVKEYGDGEYQMKANSLENGNQVLIIYDILAAPGATEAAIQLVESQGALVSGCAYVIELEYLNGRQSLGNYDLFSLVKIKDQSEGDSSHE